MLELEPNEAVAAFFAAGAQLGDQAPGYRCMLENLFARMEENFGATESVDVVLRALKPTIGKYNDLRSLPGRFDSMVTELGVRQRSGGSVLQFRRDRDAQRPHGRPAETSAQNSGKNITAGDVKHGTTAQLATGQHGKSD